MGCQLQRFAYALMIVVTPLCAAADETDSSDNLVAKITASVPRSWKVSLVGRSRELVVSIETVPMETVPSLMNSEQHRVDRMEIAPVRIEFQILPKHSPAMLKRIREYNEPIVAQLKTLPARSAERQRLASTTIDCPQFQNEQYGFRVIAPRRVPSHGEDLRTLEQVLEKVCAGWKPMEGKRVVGKIMDYFSPG